MELVLLVYESESVVVLKVRYLMSVTVRRDFHGLLLGQNATIYGIAIACNRMLSPHSVGCPMNVYHSFTVRCLSPSSEPNCWSLSTYVTAPCRISLAHRTYPDTVLSVTDNDIQFPSGVTWRCVNENTWNRSLNPSISFLSSWSPYSCFTYSIPVFARFCRWFMKKFKSFRNFRSSVSFVSSRGTWRKTVVNCRQDWRNN